MISIPINSKLSVQQVNYLMNSQKQLRALFYIQEKRRMRKKLDLEAITRHTKSNMNYVLIDIKKHFII